MESMLGIPHSRWLREYRVSGSFLFRTMLWIESAAAFVGADMRPPTLIIIIYTSAVIITTVFNRVGAIIFASRRQTALHRLCGAKNSKLPLFVDLARSLAAHRGR